MGAYIISFLIGMFVTALFLNPVELYAQVNGSTADVEWMWWLAPLAILSLGAGVIWYLIKSTPIENDEIIPFGTKGGEVDRQPEADENETYVDSLSETQKQERKLRQVYNGQDDEIEAT